MLYSEKKERENRFVIALKIAFPLLLLIAIFFYAFSLFPDTSLNLFLLIIFIPIYVYYTVYLIYHSFQTSLIDSVTKTFTCNEILSKIKKVKNKKSMIILLHVNNLEDINERYGIINGNSVLQELMKELALFLEEHHFKNTPIGRYNHNTFLLILDASLEELNHLLTIFTKRIQTKGLHNIEVILSFSSLEAHYDTNPSHTIERLFMLIDKSQTNEKALPDIQLNTFKKSLNSAFLNDGILFKYQPSLHVKEQKIALVEVLTRIYTDAHGLFTKQHIQPIINRMGLERALDKMIFTALAEKIKPLLQQKLFISIEISPVTLRNSKFKHHLVSLFKEKNLDPHSFILEIVEEKSYEQMHRFKEIIESYKEMGFKIALGNFGGNNCGFEYLKCLPIDLIKFDIEFTKKIEDVKYQKLLKSYIDLAKTLQVQSMVKFVDKESTLALIQACEPDFIQGFCISKPKSIKELSDEIR
ncbi:EAL domain-containing protein [Sulfurospirillum barnesii]|uniref:EAL domain-containing protein n=1 Tax=Sulfurospirillum barnesii (strain ATCC 700032 / DSM 10660 / SES-3) TaxID=760154 RepID=I3XTR6_SULBS|nr:GGDEF domain-containing protein [Sulfurospirillum barnesii]AFL67340.1 EAL domain-containing protein [Sulfurospirillum barnesii SES-3]